MRIKWFSLVRITGLVTVLSYHFFQTEYTGDFIGVDIFFTFSGFLITALMVDEFSRSNGFKLMAFYRRRFYRIVPPLFLSVLLVVPFTFLIGKDFITNIGQQIAAALGFTTNYFEIATGVSYETKFIPHLFVHTWSLAVEMHFYLLWGLVAFMLAKMVKASIGKSEKATQVFRWLLFSLSTVMVIGSATAMYLGTNGLVDFSRIYFSSVTHSFPFFVGSAFGAITGIKSILPAFKKLIDITNKYVIIGVTSCACLALIGLGYFLKFNQLFTYHGGLLLATFLAVIMIVSARILHDKTPNTNEPKIITFLADVSYSVYLFHWPLYVVFAHLMHNWLAAILTTVVSIILSALSYYVLEPIIAGKKAVIGHKQITWKQIGVPFSIVTVMLIGVTGYVVKSAPNMSTLERNLWLSGVHQDADKINAIHETVLADNNAGDTTTIPQGVSIIGDSVTLGTRAYLGDHVADSTIDAEGNRTMNLAYQVMIDQQYNHTLREYVVICVGTNALDDYAEQTMKIVHDLDKGHKLIFMTPYNANADDSYNSTKLGNLERKLPAKYKFITIADWGRIAPQHPDVFDGTDGVHFGGRPSGDILYAKVINQGLKDAQETPVK